MFDRKNYIVERSKLIKGNNNLEIEVDKSLFDEFECEDILDLNVKVQIEATKNERFIEFNICFEGFIEVECSRCLSPMSIKINKKNKLFVKFGDKFEEVDISQWIVEEGEDKIDLTNYIYEELRIEIPIAPIHKHKEDCNKEIIEKISSINEETKHKDGDLDPRWEKLKELKNNFKNLE